MKPTALFVLLFLAVPATAADLLIEDVTIVSAHLAAPARDQNVLIRDGYIARISTEIIAVPEDTPRLEGEGNYLTPGLMDSHHHVSFVPGMGAAGYGHSAEHDALTNAYLRQQPRSLLYHGVTQVLDPAPLDTSKAFEDAPRHPDLFRCGAIPNPGGYPGNQATGTGWEDSFVYRVDREPPEAVVERIADDGAICVKLFIEDGFGDLASWPMLSDETLKRIAAAARSHGLLVYVHANAIDMYHVALGIGPDVIGHGLWNWQWPGNGEPPVERMLDRVVADNVGYIATHQVMWGLAAQLEPDTLDDPAYTKVVPPALLEWYATPAGQWFADELEADFPPDMPRERMARILAQGHARAQLATGYLAGLGYPLLLGSDCPGSATSANQPGLCTLKEIQSLAAAGVAPDAIFRAATINNARQFGLDDRYGTVEPDKVANLLLLDANPLIDPAAWNRIHTVILHGDPIPRERLAATSN